MDEDRVDRRVDPPGGNREEKARMKRTLTVIGLALGLSAAAAAAQELPSERLPPELAVQVQARIDLALSRGLPDQALAQLALEGVAKGRSATEVLVAVDALLAELGQARGALEAGGHAPVGGEVEAATAAMRMGVDGTQVSALARSGPSGRGLTVPLLVMAGLAQRGLPADQALLAVQERMAAGAGDDELLLDFPGAAQGAGRGMGMRPAHAGSGIGLGGGGPRVNPAGIMIPIGPPVDRPRPGRRPGGS